MSIVANFKPGQTRIFTEPAYRYDYGQTLEIDGIGLTETFIAHFSNTEELGVATTALGTNGQVRIPDEYLRHNWDHIFVFIFVGDSEEGQTKYQIIIPVKNRPGLADPIPTPVEDSIIQQSIGLLNENIAGINTTMEQIRNVSDLLQQVQIAADIIEDAAYILSGMENLFIDGGDANYISEQIEEE